MLLIVLGVIWIGAFRLDQSFMGLLFSVLTGVFIGTYTLLDGQGGRIGSSPHAYAAWLFLLTSVPVVAIAFMARRGTFAKLSLPLWSKGVSVGVVSAASYWVIVWAMSVAPMGLVAAVRESSVVFAALIGSFFLRERVRWIGVVLRGR